MCTCLTLNNPGFYFGRNLDLDYSFNESVTITPRNYKFPLKNGKLFYNTYALIGMATVVNEYPLYAEAMNEAYGPTVRPSGFRSTNALTSVNRVRERADVQLPPIPEDVTEEQLREIIRHERQVELAFEDHRCWDVRRWMIAPSTLGAPLRGVEITKTGDDSYTYEPIIVEQRVFEPKMYLYPIPQADLNTTGWPQNPLW